MLFVQKALVWLMENLYNYMIPVCLLCILRIVMCVLELKHMSRLREKKFVFRKVSNHYKEIGTFVGLFIGCVAVCVLPLKLLWAVVAVVLAVVGFKVGAKKGAAADAFWREVVDEIAASEEADMLAEAPQIDSDVSGLLGNLDLYGEEEKAAEAKEPVAESEEA